MRLKGKAAIITGGQQGLGLAFTRRYLDEGARVVIASLFSSPDIDALTAAGKPLSFIRTDVTRLDDCAAMAKHAVDTFGTVDILLNNAGFFAGVVRQEIENIPTEEIMTALTVNVLGVFNCIKSVAPIMKARKYGKIINIGSGSMMEGVPFMPHYVASKAAVMGMTRSLAREFGPYCININTIGPGFTPTAGAMENDSHKISDANRIDGLHAQLRSINRPAEPDDLTGLAVFLASSDSDFMTGDMIMCDGGVSMY